MVNRDPNHELPTIWEVPESLRSIFWEILSTGVGFQVQGHSRQI